jgi:hypothetical protein
MKKNSPKTKPPITTPTPTPAKKNAPITIKKERLPPDAAKRRRQFLEDSAEIERQLRGING